MALSRISPADLRWRVDPRSLDVGEASRTAHSATLERLVGSLSQAIADRAPGRGHVFVRGHAASDRSLLLEQGLERLKPPERERHDYCLVHNFEQPDRPRLICLPAGTGRKFRSAMNDISRFIRDQLENALQARPIRNRLQALEERSDAEMRRVTAPLEKKLKPHMLVLMREEVGQMMRLTVHVQQTGRVITQDDLANLVAKGQVGPEEFESIRAVIREAQPEIRRITQSINKTWSHAHRLRARLLRAETRRLLADLVQPVLEQFEQPEIKQHVDAVIADVLEKRVDNPTEHLADPELLYGINLVHTASGDPEIPVIYEQVPTPRNIGGTIDPAWLENRRSVASFLGVRGGSLLTASGGFLVIDAEDLLGHPRSISLLRNALANGAIHIDPPAEAASSPAVSLRPAALPVDARLILCGTQDHWQRLQREHPEFVGLFAAPIDIPDSITRNAAGIGWIAGRLRNAATRVHSAPISDEAIGALVEQAARMGGPDRLSTRMGDLFTVLRMATVIAGTEDGAHVSAVHVHEAIDRMRPPRPVNSNPRFETAGFPARQHQVGQVHVCALEPDGDRNYGQLVRVQASLAHAPDTRIAFEGAAQSPGPEISIRIESALAHSMRMRKSIGLHALISCGSTSSGNPPIIGGALILGSVLALVSRLSEIPLRQDLAVIGNLDSDCRLTPVEGVNARIEDSFRIAQHNAVTGNAGVIIPTLQRSDLMLRPELVQAVRNDLFQAYAAGNLSQVLEMLTGTSPGKWRDGRFTPESMFDRARTGLLGD
ncbi:MAG: AAA family ATPase [Wenzhouxiangellaceae bacterium]|nr:AAA family ATPase [Wenzhouxiangellaceae bacterium]MBS3745959.1 AAA family ATPase [Wenzhouxiangellaceae bacterium]MBS3823290.1 AAA family ATPase [Wenzhouxiangellaceae bacterium]